MRIKKLLANKALRNFLSRSQLGRYIKNKYIEKTYINELISEGISQFEEEHNVSASNTQSNITDKQDFIKSVKKYLVSYDEYFKHFDFKNRTEKERAEFCSQVSLRLFYSSYLDTDTERVFWNKAAFLNKFHTYITRKWIEARNTTFEEFSDFVTRFDCIVKPQESCCGYGIYKHYMSKNNLRQFYQKCYDENCLLEECISNEPLLRSYHPESLNTIRIVTVRGKTRVSILGAFIRFGTGHKCTDNGGTDGILAMIDCQSGKVFTDGYDKVGIRYYVHPDSKLPIMGLQIPKWKDMVAVCESASEVVPQAKIVGWDVAVTAEGRIEIIEGNHRPDAYGLQMPIKKGYKSRLKQLMEW